METDVFSRALQEKIILKKDNEKILEEFYWDSVTA